MLKKSYFFGWALLIVFSYPFFMPLQGAEGDNPQIINALSSSGEGDSFLLKNITFQADIPFGKDEFDYIIGLKPNTFVSKKEIEAAYNRLMQKKRFCAIETELKDGPAEGKVLHFTLRGNWLLKDVRISGFLFGKYEYLNLYSQQPGDVFDQHLHEDSLAAMEKHLHGQGFFSASVAAELIYSAKNKTITPNIVIKRGQRYRIKFLHLELAPDLPKKIPASEVGQLTTMLTKLGQRYSSNHMYSKEYIDRIRTDIKTKLTKRGFHHPHVKVSKKFFTSAQSVQVGLSFSINPGKQKIVTFYGNSVFSDEQIRQLIFDDDQPDWLFTPDILTEQLSHEYRRKGYWNASVTCNKKGAHYAFTIKEGEPIIVEKIEVKNATDLSSEELGTFWRNVLRSEPLDQNVLDKKIEQLKRNFQKNGYWDFAVVDQQVIRSEYSNRYAVIIFIDKGQQRLWGGLTIPHFEELTSQEQLKKYELRNPTQKIPFDLGWLQEQKAFLTQHFQKNGYWYADIKATLLDHPSDLIQLQPNAGNSITKKVGVEWKISQGPQVTFGKVIVRGNSRLPFKRIINEIKFQEGDVWSKEKLDLTRKKLKRLDIFKRIHVQAQQSSKKSSKPIVITLADDSPVEMRLRAGLFWTDKNFLYRQQSSYSLGGSVAIKNPTNHADKLMLDANLTLFQRTLSLFERKVNLEYKQPSLLNLPLTGSFKAYTNKYIHPVGVGRSHHSYVAHQAGLVLGVGEEYNEHFYWSVDGGTEFVKTSRVTGNLKLDPSMINKTAAYAFIEPGIVFDKLDDKVNTTTGTFTFASLKLMMPTNIGDFITRANLEQSLFYPIYHNVILASRIRLGHMFRRSFEFIMPIDRFYLGGPYSVRGYEKDALPPFGLVAPPQDSNTIGEYTIQGGSSMVNANLEVRFPIFGRLAGVVFQDIGALSQSGFLAFSENWFPTSGVGLRYKTPIGPLRFDIGWKWKKTIKQDSAFAWYLTLGEAF